MPRRRRAVVREVLPDPVYNSTLVEKFVNSMMWEGKKNTAQGIFYEAMDKLRDRTSDDPPRGRRQLSGAHRSAADAPHFTGDAVDHHQRPGARGKRDGREIGERVE